MRTYKFRDMILGSVDAVTNEMAAEDFRPIEMYKEGSRMYILFCKWEDGPVVSQTEIERVYEEMEVLAGRIQDLESLTAMPKPKKKVVKPSE